LNILHLWISLDLTNLIFETLKASVSQQQSISQSKTGKSTVVIRYIRSFFKLLWPTTQVLSSSWVGRPFGHNKHEPKIGGCALFGRGQLVPHVTQCGLAETYFRTKWHLDPSSHLATTDMGRKFRWGCASSGCGAESTSNTMLPGPRTTIVPSGILIHPAVWPQQTWAENWGLWPVLGRGIWVPI